MSGKLSGKVAVVTGSGGTGIGNAIAKGIAAEGAKVVINDIGTLEDGKKAADVAVDQIKKAKGLAAANYDSVTTLAGCENLIKTAVDNFGKIDILVNCAGNFKIAPTVADFTEQDWDLTMDLHVKGYFGTIKAAVPIMKKQDTGGCIINFSSGAAFQTGGTSMFPGGLPFSFAAYGTAKAAVLGLTTNLSIELKKFGITVNSILPSAVTPLFPGIRQRILGGPTGGPEDIAPVVVFLATDRAKEITGKFVYVCAGDVCIFPQPCELPGENIFVRKMDKWTVDELTEVFPPLVGL
jgi:NAD(P)-dependent dehydrogenase (short-subunit alcohol dehydrogenase family)